MYGLRQKIFWFAISTRIVIFILQFLFNLLCPDHNADAFKTPKDPEDKSSIFDVIIDNLICGLTRWDGEYFMHIAKYGYTYENTLAFYPFYPISTQVISIILRKILFFLTIHNIVTIVAVSLNFICFVKSALIFYDLSVEVLKSKNVAYKAALLFCINPASIFFSAVYSESIFAYFTFYSMLASIKNYKYAPLPVGLSTLVRSNGIINIGFPIYFCLKDLCHTLPLETNFHDKKITKLFKNYCYIFWNIFHFRSVLTLFNIIVTSLTPFILLQIFNYVSFCIPNSNIFLPVHVVEYGIQNNLVLRNNTDLSWCKDKIPVAYSNVQTKYWNVGFMRYYELKQIPNFILAFPILYIMIKCATEYFTEHKSDLYSLELFMIKENGKVTNASKIKKYPENIFVYIIHGFFLTIFSICFIHIQVSTRLLCSASPLPYWFCALSMSQNYKDNLTYESAENASSKWKVCFMSQKKYNMTDKLILSYFVGYTIIGCFMFSNFLPWT